VTPRTRLELLALRLALHGYDGLDRRAVRALGRSTLWLETRNLLREHGFTEAEIATLIAVHPRGCPCWKCVQALNRAAHKHRARLLSRRPNSAKG
jgi:hypothetical protein